MNLADAGIGVIDSGTGIGPVVEGGLVFDAFALVTLRFAASRSTF